MNLNSLLHPPNKMTMMLSFIIVAVFLSCFSEAQKLGTKSMPPLITSVNPFYGSVKGGTRLSIKGTNFKQNGLFSQAVVLINNAECKVIDYYTNNDEIVCITPECTTSSCLESTDFQGTESVALNVYVTTVEGILGAISTFTYRGQYTSQVFKMSHTTWGSATHYVQGKIMTSSIEDVTIKIGNQFADVGDPDELNPEEFNRWSTSSQVFYHAPEDLVAGYYNLSLEIQNENSDYLQGSGLANMFDTQVPIAYNKDYSHGYNFDASPDGEAYSLCVLPSITGVTPAQGSIAGGTVVTITGTGFSSNEDRMTVYAAGRICDVVSSSKDTITCITRPGANASELEMSGDLDISSQSNDSPPAFTDQGNLRLVSSRQTGSAGWWVNMWPISHHYANTMTPENIGISFGLRQEMSFGLYYDIDKYWYQDAEYDSEISDVYEYAAEYTSVFIAPYEGDYTFYMVQDDYAWLYGRRQSESTETLLMYHTYSPNGDYFYNGQSESDTVSLQKGERFNLRVKLVNTASADWVELSVRVDPANVAVNSPDKDELDEMIATGEQPLVGPSELSDVFKFHHSFSDVQLIDLDIGFRYEKQRVRITGVSSGSYYIIVQGYTVTSALTASSSATSVSNAIRSAALSISSSIREASSFNVEKTTSSDGNTIWLDVEFVATNTQPLTELSVFTGELTGGNLSFAVTRTQVHSVIPSGNFDLTYEDPETNEQTTLVVPFSQTNIGLQTQLQEINPNINVEVSRAGGSYTGYSYSVTFTTPRGSIPLMRINTSNIIGDEIDGVSGSVTKLQEGNADSLYFRGIPVWMVEVPLEETHKDIVSSVEVYVTANDGSFLKSVCDSSPRAGPGFLGMFKGSEEDCAFHLTGDSTALVSNFSLSAINAELTQIDIFGNRFTMSDVTANAPSLTVTIADHPCNITSVSDTHIVCEVASVPHGSYQPVVHLEGYGNALVTAGDDNMLNFKLSVYSVTPSTGSFAGGQILNISGRGFRPGSEITLAGHTEPCEMLTYTSSELTCRVPAAPHVYTSPPTDGPTIAPSFEPTAVPSFEPTAMPSFEPSAVPSFGPSEAPTEDFYAGDDFYQADDFYGNEEGSRRALSTGDNEYSVMIDGQAANGASFTYTEEDTPRIADVFPAFLSSAITTNVTFAVDFVPAGASDDVSVVVGDEECTHIQYDGFTLTCTLTRNRAAVNYNKNGLVDVQINFPGYGFASSADWNLKPQVGRGFYVNSVSPAVGSVMGGNRLTVHGTGFLAGFPARHEVKLEKNGLENLDAYNTLLGALGFDLANPYNPEEVLACEVVSVTEDEIVCDLAGHPELAYPNLDYTITVTLNSVSSTTVTEDDSVIVYSQDLEFTPIVTSTTVDSTDPTRDPLVDTYKLSLELAQGFPADLSGVMFMVGDAMATYTDGATKSSTEAHLDLQSIPHGIYNLTATVPGFGYALVHNSEIPVITTITSVTAATTEGSIAGGTPLTINGIGFSGVCDDNNVTVSVTIDGSEVVLLTPTYLSCAPYRLEVLSPAIARHLGDNFVLRDNFAFSVAIDAVSYSEAHHHEEVEIVVTHDDDGHAGHRRLSSSPSDTEWTVFATDSSVFSYTVLNTPLAVVGAHEGYAGDTLYLAAFMYQNGELAFCDTEYDSHAVSSRKLHVVNQCSNTHSAVTIGDGACMTLNHDDNLDDFYADNDIEHAHSDTRAMQKCLVPAVPASVDDYDVLIQLYPFGYALDNSSATIALPAFKSLIRTTTSFASTIDSSTLGGLNITIEGNGFPADAHVTVCDCPCIVPSDENSVQYGSIQCAIPDHYTKETHDAVIAAGIDLDRVESATNYMKSHNIFTYFSSLGTSSTQNDYFHDVDFDTYFSHSSASCFIGLTLPDGFEMMPSRMRFYPRLSKASSFGTYYFEGSTDGGTTYTTLATHTGTVHEGFNYIDVDEAYANNWYSTFRYRSGDSSISSKCEISEIEFTGVTGATFTSCDITVKAPSVGYETTVGSVTFQSIDTFTPRVESITPDNGTALGGVEVTLHGHFFDSVSTQADSTPLTVALSGVGCDVVSSTATEIVCITGVRTPEDVRISSIEVIVPGRGRAIVDDDVEFLYVDRWSALTSWKNQEMPVDGDIVWIPDGQVIMLDGATPELVLLYVQGDLLVDPNLDFSIDATYIYIDGGRFQVGTPEEPYEKNGVITLHGDRYKTIEIPHIGAKCLVVNAKGQPHMGESGEKMPGRDQGHLELHGKKRMRTWTFVDLTAEAGTNWVWTHEPVDFAYGESVILTGSEIPGGDTMANAVYGYEEMVVLETLDGGHNVTFTTNLKFTHRSEVYHIEGREVPLKFEIGLLSRNLKLTGDENSPGQLFGVHSVAIHSGIFRIENVEVTRCGQAFNFGRYCTHSHETGDMTGSYVKANSIHHSFQRAVTTHETLNWEVRDNVAFDVTGHAYFVEDGTEELNYITGNLGVFIQRSSALLKSDMKPAIFWQQTPFNYWRDNVAAHSASFGMWFELKAEMPSPGGGVVCCQFQPLGEFYNNTFHSNSVMGLRIYPQWTPLNDPCDHESGPSPQYLYNLLSYRNGGNGLFSKKHGDLHHINPTIVENGGNDVHIIKYKYVDYTMDATIKDGLIVGKVSDMDDFDEDTTNLYKRAIHGPQDEYFFVENTTIMNYGKSGAIAACNACLNGEKMNQGCKTHRYKGMKFVNTTLRLVYEGGTEKDIFWDLDGSLGGVADSMITKDINSLHWEDACTVMEPTSIYGNSIRCGGAGSDVRIRRMSMESVTPSQLANTDIYVRGGTHAGGDEFYYLPLDTSGWVFPVLTGRNKSFSFTWNDAGLSAYTMKMTLGHDDYMEETKDDPRYDDTVIMNYKPNFWDYDPYTYRVTYEYTSRMASKNSTRSLLRMAQSQYKNKTLSTVFSTNERSLSTANSPYQVSIEGQLCPPEGCPVPPVPTLDDPMLWSDPGSWPSGKVPGVGQRVTIESNMWIVMDISPPKLGGLTIEGKLSFLSNESNPLDLELQTPSIAVYGYFHIRGNASTDSDGTDAFKGTATVTMFGTKGTVWPLTMTEGVYLGSKVIGNTGEILVSGTKRSKTWTRLRSTVAAASNTIDLDSTVEWEVGDEITVSPTGYFTDDGTDVMAADTSETHTIASVTSVTDSEGTFTRITTESNLVYSHLCETAHGESFCGAVGHLTSNVRFVSVDQDDSSSNSFGYGANIHVFDIPDDSRYGYLEMSNVEFKGFGKINSDHYAITMKYRDYNHPPSIISSCSFNQGYNMAVRIEHGLNFTFEDNVATGNYGGGVHIEEDTSLFLINHNLISGSYMLPSNLLSSYPWTNPISAFVVYSGDGVVHDNLAAGSQDNGFIISVKMLKVSSELAAAVCSVTQASAYTYTLSDLTTDPKFSNNEAVGCRTGITILTMSAAESVPSDCAVVANFIAWRSGHIGIMSQDAEAGILLANVLLAENHIGVNLHFYKSDVSVFTGIVSSTIIGSLGNTVGTTCTDLADSLWSRGGQCQAFTQSDPFGVSTSCGSVVSDIYRRVGVLIPQWTNKPRSCALMGRFDCPTTPLYPDRLCSQPWDSRYALPPSIAYAEQHIHDTTFIGFADQTVSSNSYCIPSNTHEKSVAVAINPNQYDHQPTVVMSGMSYTDVDASARFGFDIGSRFTAECKWRPCSGQSLLMINDLDGSVANEGGESGQLFFNNPNYVAPTPLCRTASSLHQDLYFCTDTPVGTAEPAFKQYWGMWRDWGPQVIHPIVIDRKFEGEDLNRSFSMYGPIDDMCALRFYFSRFNLAIADGQYHDIRATGTLPNEFLITWEAPSSDNVAILNIFVQHGSGINVMVSDHPTEGFVHVPKFTERYPTLEDPAGSNTRDPQNRVLSVTIRGGTHHYYRFITTPKAAVTMKMDMSLENFFADTFIANIALLLGIDASRIKITQVSGGTSSSRRMLTEGVSPLIVDFEVDPLTEVAVDSAGYNRQLDELNNMTSTFSSQIQSGAVETLLGVPIQELYVDVPVVPVIFDETIELPANSTVNATEFREAIINENMPRENILMTYPTSRPTGQPSGQPSSAPTSIPTSIPTSAPTTVPTSTPTSVPSSVPSSTPTSVPTSSPTSTPSSVPTSTPSVIPTSTPTSAPTTVPTSTPTSVPSSAPSSIPTSVPTSSPTSIPSSVPTSAPTIVPTSRPTSQPTNPTSRPTALPSTVPTAGPTHKPTPVPSAVPSFAPTAVPSLEPTAVPSVVPSFEPTAVPSLEPTAVPSVVPSFEPTAVPSLEPTAVPSAVPSYEPTAVPSFAPSFEPTAVPSFEPTVVPSFAPSFEPTAVPSYEPTAVPSFEPSAGPSFAPSLKPSAVPSFEPSAVPSFAPSLEPSAVPSFKPTAVPTAVPSLEPSAVPTAVPSVAPSTYTPSELPSSRPTGQVSEQIGFTVSSGIDNANCNALDDQTSRDAWEQAITDNTDIPDGASGVTVTVLDCVLEASNRRRLAGDDDTTLGHIVLTYEVKIEYYSFLNFDAQDVYDDFVASLTTALTNGDVTTSLRASGAPSFASAAATADGLQVSEFTTEEIDRLATQSPTKKPTNSAKSGGLLSFSGDNLYYAIAAIFIIAALLIITCYYVVAKRSKVPTDLVDNPVKIKPISSGAPQKAGHLEHADGSAVLAKNGVRMPGARGASTTNSRFLSDDEMDIYMTPQQKEEYLLAMDPSLKQAAPQIPLRESALGHQWSVYGLNPMDISRPSNNTGTPANKIVPAVDSNGSAAWMPRVGGADMHKGSPRISLHKVAPAPTASQSGTPTTGQSGRAAATPGAVGPPRQAPKKTELTIGNAAYGALVGSDSPNSASIAHRNDLRIGSPLVAGQANGRQKTMMRLDSMDAPAFSASSTDSADGPNSRGQRTDANPTHVREPSRWSAEPN